MVLQVFQSEPVAWTELPADCRRHLITRLSQLAYRQLRSAAGAEGALHDRHPRSLSDLGVRIAIFPIMRPKKCTFCIFIALSESI
jgi:hypothetical protein